VARKRSLLAVLSDVCDALKLCCKAFLSSSPKDSCAPMGIPRIDGLVSIGPVCGLVEWERTFQDPSSCPQWQPLEYRNLMPGPRNLCDKTSVVALARSGEHPPPARPSGACSRLRCHTRDCDLHLICPRSSQGLQPIGHALSHTHVHSIRTYVLSRNSPGSDSSESSH
jgi:hypothetical protein